MKVLKQMLTAISVVNEKHALTHDAHEHRNLRICCNHIVVLLNYCLVSLSCSLTPYIPIQCILLGLWLHKFRFVMCLCVLFEAEIIPLFLNLCAK